MKDITLPSGLVIAVSTDPAVIRLVRGEDLWKLTAFKPFVKS